MRILTATLLLALTLPLAAQDIKIRGGNVTTTGTQTLTNKTLVNPIGSGGYVMDSATVATLALADLTTYYFGWGESASAASHQTITNVQMVVPKAGTITSVSFQVIISVNGSNEAVQHYLRLNNTTDTQLSLTETYDPGSGAPKQFAYTGLSIAVAAGDTIAFKIVGPTWATNPTFVSTHLRVFVD